MVDRQRPTGPTVNPGAAAGNPPAGAAALAAPLLRPGPVDVPSRAAQRPVYPRAFLGFRIGARLARYRSKADAPFGVSVYSV